MSNFCVKVGRQQYAPCRASDSSRSCSVASGFPVEVYISHAHAGVRADAALSIVSRSQCQRIMCVLSCGKLGVVNEAEGSTCEPGSQLAQGFLA